MGRDDDAAHGDPGVGEAMRSAAFRDPIAAERQVAALTLDIARVLVRAPHLPVDLPVAGLRLLTVDTTKTSIDLVMGLEHAIARLHIVARGGGSSPERAGSGAVVVTVQADTAQSPRIMRDLATMAARVERAVTEDMWREAMSMAKRIAEVPQGVPLAFYRQLVPGVDATGLVRTGFNCNQNCGICWQDRTWASWGPRQLRMWIEDLHAAGARRLIISGGEPTLDAALSEHIAHARALGYEGVTLETNAIQFARHGLAEGLRAAGLSDCFVSLHSGDAVVSDRITRAPRTFARTVAGIHALLAAHVPVRINCVMTAEGLAHLERLPDFLHDAFGSHPLLAGLMVSQPSDPWDRALLPTIIPDPVQVRRVLPCVIDRAAHLGIALSGLDGPCGPPLCAHGADPRVTRREPIPEQLDGRVYLSACDDCTVRAACFGARVADIELYGDRCVKPVTAGAEQG